MALKRQVDLGFVGKLLPEGTHMCLLYDDETQRRSVISKFLESGLATGERVAYFADTMSPEEVRVWLAELGIEIPGDELDGSGEISSAESVYCPGGEFIPEDMLNVLRSAHEGALSQGFPGIRVSGEMSWALKAIPGSARLIEYEAMVNDVLVTHPVTAMCQYDTRSLDGATIMKLLRVHPMMVVRSQIVRNPYYMRPHDFIMKERGGCGVGESS